MRTLFLIGVIIYSAASLLTSHWPAMANATGAASASFLALMVVDLLFAGAAAIKLAGPAFFNSLGDDEGEITVTSDDLNVPDSWFYGAFGFNLLVNIGASGYTAVFTTGGESVAASIWFMIEVVGILLTFMFFRHAQQVARRKIAGNIRRVA